MKTRLQAEIDARNEAARHALREEKIFLLMVLYALGYWPKKS